MTQDKEDLFERGSYIVAYLARGIYKQNKLVDIDDLVQFGYIGLIKACNTYDPCRGAKFSTYASKCIRNEMICALKKEMTYRRHVAFSIDEDKDDDCDFGLIDVLYNERDFVETVIDKKCDIETLSNAMRELQYNEAKIISLRYLHFQTQHNVALSLNRSQSNISRIERKGLKKLRTMIKSSI